MNRSPEYEVHIDELVVDGYDSTMGAGIAEGVRNAVERSVQDAGLQNRVADAGIGEATGSAVARAILEHGLRR